MFSSGDADHPQYIACIIDAISSKNISLAPHPRPPTYYYHTNKQIVSTPSCKLRGRGDCLSLGEGLLGEVAVSEEFLVSKIKQKLIKT